MAPCISVVRENMYDISFRTKEFMRRAIEEGLWLVMGCCLIVKHCPREDTEDEVDFSKVDFWVLVHNLPVELMTVKNVEVIGGKLGRLIGVDEQWNVEGIGRGFLRIRLGMLMEKPFVDAPFCPDYFVRLNIIIC